MAFPTTVGPHPSRTVMVSTVDHRPISNVTSKEPIATDSLSVTSASIGIGDDDDDRIYPYYGYFGNRDYTTFKCSIEDSSGAGNILQVELHMLGYVSGTYRTLWGVSWDRSTGFAEIYDGTGDSDNINLRGGTISESGTRLTVYFHISLHWNHPETDNFDLSVDAYSGSGSDGDTFNTVWDVRTGLVFSLNGITPSTTRCDRGAVVDFTSSVHYSANYAEHPPAGAVEIVPERTSPTSWTGNGVLLGDYGSFTVPCETYAGTSYEENIFTFHVYDPDTGYEVMTGTGSVQTDAVVGSAPEADDTVINVGSTTQVRTTLTYYSDGAIVTSGTCSWSDHSGHSTSLTYSSSLQKWVGDAPVLTSPGTVRLDTLSITTSHGVTDVATHPTISIISTWVEVTVFGATDQIVSVGDTVTLYVKAILPVVEEGHALGTGDTITLTDGSNTYLMTWIAENSRFECEVLRDDIAQVTFTIASASEATYGITAIDPNSPSVTVTWDRIDVTNSGIVDNDGRVDLGAAHTVWFTLGSHYFGTALADGDSVTTNYGAATWNGSAGRWEMVVPAQSTVCTVEVYVTAAHWTSEDVKVLEPSPSHVVVVWDTLMVDLNITDSRVDVGDTVRVWAKVTRAYDHSQVTAGSVALWPEGGGISIAMTHYANGLWYADVASPSVGELGHYLYDIHDNDYGLTKIGRGWTFDGTDDYLSCDADVSLDITSELTISAWFSIGDYGDFGSFIVAKKDANDAQYSLFITNDGALKFIYYANALYIVDLSGGALSKNTWHHVIVRIDGTTLMAWIDGSLEQSTVLSSPLQSFPSVPLYVGADDTASGLGTAMSHFFTGAITEVRIYATALTDAQCIGLYRGNDPTGVDLRLRLDRTSVSVFTGEWLDRSTRGNTAQAHSVSVSADPDFPYPSSPQEVVRPIWDLIVVNSYSSDNLVINVGQQAVCHVTLVYAFDGEPVTDGDVAVNGLPAIYSGHDGIWDFGELKTSPQKITYDTVTYSGGSYGLSSVDQNAASLEQTWDMIVIQSMTVTDSRIDVATPAEIHVVARLSVLGTTLNGADSIYLNGSLMLWNETGGYFYYYASQTSVGLRTFTISSCLDSGTGITAFNGTISVSVIWDEVDVTITGPDDSRINLGENASGIVAHAVYAYDGRPYNGTVNLNYTVFTHYEVGRHGYAAISLGGDDEYGIVRIGSSNAVYCIWDALIITFDEPNPFTVVVGENASGIVARAVYAYDGQPYDGDLFLNNTQFQYSTAGTRAYTVIGVADDTYDVTYIVSNDILVVEWSLLRSVIHMWASATESLVSTAYDPIQIQVAIFLLDSNGQALPGNITLTIGDETDSIYCDGTKNSVFFYTPRSAGYQVIIAEYGGDMYHLPGQANVSFNIHPRVLTYSLSTPPSMTPSTPAVVELSQVYDTEFYGTYNSVEYTGDYPVELPYNIWWALTLNSTKHWVIGDTTKAGEGLAYVVMPWDLDGDGVLTHDDFTFYLFIEIDGGGVYQVNSTAIRIDLLQPLTVELHVPTLVYSDTATLVIDTSPLHGPCTIDDFEFDVVISISQDGKEWSTLSELQGIPNHYSLNWTCDLTGTVFFKVEACGSGYTPSSNSTVMVVEPEHTVLSLAFSDRLTYGDAGWLVVQLTTDDGEPLVDWPVAVTLLGEDEMTIGLGQTNSSGLMTALWTPMLPAGTYQIQVNSSQMANPYYCIPDCLIEQVVVNRETTVAFIGTEMDGTVFSTVLDDEGNPVEGVIVAFYVGNEEDYRVRAFTDSEGRAYLSSQVEEGEFVRVVVEANDYYLGCTAEDSVSIPMGISPLVGVTLGGVFLSMLGIAIGRKIYTFRRSTHRASVTPTIAEAIATERESITERIHKHTKSRIVKFETPDAETDRSLRP